MAALTAPTYDPSYNTLNQEQQGGAAWVTAGAQNIDGATAGANGQLFVNGVAVAGVIAFTIAAGSGGSNQTNVTIQVQDIAANSLSTVFELEWYLSDNSDGHTLTATSASGTVGAGSSGVDIFAKVSKKAGDSITDATGKYVLAIVDSAKTGFYVVALCPGTGRLFVSRQLLTADYG